MSTSNAVSNVLGNFGGQLGLVNTGIGMKNADGTINVSGTLQGIAATTESQFALAGKSFGLTQAVIGGWGVVNTGIQVYENYQNTGTFSVTGAHWSSLAGNGMNVVMGVAKSTPWGAAGTAAATVAELGFNIATASQPASNTNYSNEGRNYQTPTYNFGPNYRGNGFTDPRLLDNSGGYRGLNTYSGVYASQAAENAAFEQDWNTALNAYSTQPSYTSFPTDPAAYNGYADAFGETPTNNSVHDFWSPSSASPPSIAPSASTSNYSPPAYGDEGGWSVSGMLSGAFAFAVSFSWVFPLVVDLDDDGVEIKPLDRSTTYFDFDGDGYKERTAWVGADDGMLVIDLNGDGQVTRSKEMALGEWTSEQDTDLQALGKVFDSNKDGTALDLSDGTSIAGLFKVQRTNGKMVEEAE